MSLCPTSLQGLGSTCPENLGILEYQLILQPSDTTQSSAWFPPPAWALCWPSQPVSILFANRQKFMGSSVVDWPHPNMFSFSLGKTHCLVVLSLILAKKTQFCKIQLLYVCILPSFSLNDFSCCRRVLYTFNQMIDFIILVTWYPIIK